MMEIKPPQLLLTGDACEKCRTALFGNLVVRSSVINGVGLIGIVEDNPRNWILCDGCNALLCHSCAPQYKTGCCEGCLAKQCAEVYGAGENPAPTVCKRCGQAADDGEGDTDSVRCDLCRVEFDRFSLCRACYYRPYPLRLCAGCLPELFPKVEEKLQ